MNTKYGTTDTLQTLCREYLTKLRPIAVKFGLGVFLDDTLEASLGERCVATEEEVELLARACDDERVTRTEVPRILGKSYRRSVEDEDFEHIKTLHHVGIYSKVSVLLHKNR